MKKIIFVLLAIGLVACKKDNEVVPEYIEFTVTTSLDRNGIYPLDSTKLNFRGYKDSSIVVVAYTDSEGKAIVRLKKDTEYYYTATTRTFNGPHYYVYKGAWLRSSWESGGNQYYQKGWNVYFYDADWQNGTGATAGTSADPSI
jgi:hypothetical protein